MATITQEKIKEPTPRLGLSQMVAQRKTLVKYLSNKDINAARQLIKDLGLRG